jgi:hypothetical protein
MKNMKRPPCERWFFIKCNIIFKKDLEDSTSQLNFAPVLSDSLIKKGRGKWPDDALAT